MNPAITAAVMGFLGLAVGGVLATISVRLPQEAGDPLARPRCPACARRLRLWEVVPLVGWLGLRGKCATCRTPIPPRHMAIELASAAVGVWAGLGASSWLAVGATAALGWQLLLIAVIDAEHHWLPDRLTWPLALTGLIAAVLSGWSSAPDRLIGVAVGFLGLWVLGWLYKIVRGRDGLGGGDPFLLAGAGAWVGWQGLPSVLIWAAAAAMIVVFWQLIGRRAIDGAERLPFGVFMAAGAWLTWLYGPVWV